MQENLIVTDRLASVGELAAGIAHELNNPLTSVIGFSDLLMERDDLPHDIRDDVSIINKESVRASQVARHLLTFARKHPDEKKAVNINEVLLLVMELRAYEQKVSNIKVVYHLEQNIPPVLANDFQLQQVFVNIIINAEHFMIEAHEKGTLVITTAHTENTVRITITDDGPGIPPDYLTRIFDPFFTTKEIGKGTGLGLSICYGIITEHEGRIWAENKAGEGATFIIELPVYKNTLSKT
jgi:signal transduction histidine kinase